MRISHVQIHNFRSIKDLEFDAPEFMVLIGPNNHGKSNILAAIGFALSPSTKVGEDDFFAYVEQDEKKTVRERELWVELTLLDLTEQERTTLGDYVLGDEAVTVRRSASLAEDGNADTRYQGYVEQPELWWLRPDACERLSTRAAIETEAELVHELRPLLEFSGKITKQQVQELQNSYIRENRKTINFARILASRPPFAGKIPQKGALPEFHHFPAICDLEEEGKPKATTMFGRLLQRAVQDMAEHDQPFIDLQKRISELFKELNARRNDQEAEPSQLAKLEFAIREELKTWSVNVAIECTPPPLTRLFELGTELVIDDGLRTAGGRKGHGLQRGLLFALLRTWANVLRTEAETNPVATRCASQSVVFSIEEPELFLHPHAQRQLSQALRAIASTSGHQVFVCSHSTHFVNLKYPRSIAVASKRSLGEGTKLRQCQIDPFQGPDASDQKARFNIAYWVNPDRGEMFFGQKVIFVEGETEQTLLPFLAKKLGCFDPSVSVINCGGKSNLRLYITLANAFELHYAVVHDEDSTADPGNVQLNSMLYTLAHAKNLGDVLVLRPDFEVVAGISDGKAQRKGKPLAALEHFATTEPDEIPPDLVHAIREAYRC